jgi:uncharacterized protein (DUF983 family)
MLSTVGLALTVVSWIIQLYRTAAKKDPKLNPAFLVVYAVGCVLLAVDNFTGNDSTAGILNALDVILPVVILATLIVGRRTA